jgi:hypothetical protein
MGDPAGKRSGLACAGTGEDEEWAVLMLDGPALLCVELEHTFAA